MGKYRFQAGACCPYEFAAHRRGIVMNSGFDESGFLEFLAEVLEAEFSDLAPLGGFDH